MRKIVFTTLGSYGDLHPFMAMARVLKKHGDNVTIATHSFYKDIVEMAGFSFIPMRPGLEDIRSEESWSKQANDNNNIKGTEFVVRQLLTYLQNNYRVLMDVTEGCDLIISHQLAFAAPIVAQKRNIPWISCRLQPSTFFSVYDPPALGFLPMLPKLRFLGPSFFRFLFRIIKVSTMKWFTTVDTLRAEISLPLMSNNPMIGYYSPYGTLALFPNEFAPSQPDWPKNSFQVGFPLFDKEDNRELSEPLRKFIEDGSAPVVFTLGSVIVLMDSHFFEVAYQAVKETKVRAVFLVGKKMQNLPVEAKKDSQVFISEYEPFSALFPFARAVVHQCGIGTTAQALTAGRPQILVPFAHDQPDNAYRVKKLGIGLTLPIKRFNARKLSSAIKEITENDEYLLKAQSFSRLLGADNFSKNIIKALDRFEKIDNLVSSENTESKV